MSIERIFIEIFKLDISDRVDRVVAYLILLLLEDYLLPCEFDSLLALFYDSKFINPATFYDSLTQLSIDHGVLE
jgi:hypothetical protein